MNRFSSPSLISMFGEEGEIIREIESLRLEGVRISCVFLDNDKNFHCVISGGSIDAGEWKDYIKQVESILIKTVADLLRLDYYPKDDVWVLEIVYRRSICLN